MGAQLALGRFKILEVTFQVNIEGKFLIFLDVHVIYSGVKCLMPNTRGEILQVCKKLGVSC